MVRHDAESEDAPVLAVKAPDFGRDQVGAIRGCENRTPRGGACGQERNRTWLGVNGLMETGLFPTRFLRRHVGRIAGWFISRDGAISLGRG